MEFTKFTDNELHVEFHYCPLVTAGQELGFDDETIDTLCDTIEKGCKTCSLKFKKK